MKDQIEESKGLDFYIDDKLFSLFSGLIYNNSGIRLNGHKKILLTSRLAKRLKKSGINNFYDYYRRVKSDAEELKEMLNCISTNTTNFFRESHHFEYLKNKIIPEPLKDKSEKTTRIWSAGCSTGEEPYSIAIAVCEALRTVPANPQIPPLKRGGVGGVSGWNVKILATDISTKVLEAAQTGIYEYKQLPPDIHKDIIGRYFLRGVRGNEGKIKIKDSIKKMVRFGRLNLKDETYPFKNKFDVIFCRNVMIYFDENMKQHILSKFNHHLSDGGYLFLGHSETMFRTSRFKQVFTTVYSKI